MKIEILQKINNLSKFIFTDSEFNFLLNSLNSHQYSNIRIFLEDKCEEINNDILNEKFDTSLLISEYNKCDKLLDIVIDLIISDDVEEDEGEFKKYIRQ